MSSDILFTVYNPYIKNKFYTFIELMFNIQMYPTCPIHGRNVYNIYIKNNKLFTHTVNNIDNFIKNDVSYEIYTNGYSKTKLVLKITIYKTEIRVEYTAFYTPIIKGNDMAKFIDKIENISI